jgi:hypothetical protein
LALFSTAANVPHKYFGQFCQTKYNSIMAENSAENSGSKGPQPQFEIPKVQETGQEKQTEQAIERRQISEGAPAKAAPKFPVQQPAGPPAQAPQIQKIPIQTQSSSPPISSGLQAQDTDLIEKEWVLRAKSIVAQTQDDPFKQKNEMSKIKADYIKKRFNKTIPLEDTKK